MKRMQKQVALATCFVVLASTLVSAMAGLVVAPVRRTAVVTTAVVASSSANANAAATANANAAAANANAAAAAAKPPPPARPRAYAVGTPPDAAGGMCANQAQQRRLHALRFDVLQGVDDGQQSGVHGGTAVSVTRQLVI